MNHSFDHPFDKDGDFGFSHTVQKLVGRSLADVERELICGTLARCGGNRTWAADILGIDLMTLRDKLIELRAPEADEVKQKQAEPKDAHMVLLQGFQPGRRLPS
ncbi:FlbD [Ahrensia sp. R2A130]|nr:FlbD [Ahrensia sp. R2A130]